MLSLLIDGADEIIQMLLINLSSPESDQDIIARIEDLASDIENLKVWDFDEWSIQLPGGVQTSVEGEILDRVEDLEIYDE